MLGIGFLAVWFLVSCLCQAENFRQGTWRMMFTLDVVAPGASLSTAAQSKQECSLHCLQLEDCQTSAFHQHSATCWLYPYLVGYGNIGIASPGTRYFWRLSPSCPEDLGYKLEAGICFKVYTTPMNWNLAEDTCRKDGGHLLIADTAEKRSALSKKLTTARAWLGASDQVKEGEWRWNDGTLMTGNPIWYPGNPNNYAGTQHFLQMFSTGEINDESAGYSSLPACQIPLL